MSGDGGPAFPRIESIQTPQSVNWERPQYSKVESAGGMSLRDYFAAKAMQGMLANYWNRNYDSWAEHAYQMADAMLKARST